MRNFTIIDALQRSPEWFQARLGRLTGTAAADMLDILKDGKSPGYKRRDLKARLVAERLSGTVQENGFVSAEMQRGIDKEADAIAAYEARTGLLVRSSGFLSRNDVLMGCSLDGHIGDFEGIVEVKCPKTATHLRWLRDGKLPPEHVPQVTHNLCVSGAKWCDFVSFDDRLPEVIGLFVVRVERHDGDIAAYELKARQFLREVDEEVAYFSRLMMSAVGVA